MEGLDINVEGVSEGVLLALLRKNLANVLLIRRSSIRVLIAVLASMQ
jgi:hypothetical protein